MIPDPDPVALPAPVALLQFLLVLTFVLHLLPMNLVLGGGFVAAWAALRGRGASPEAARQRALAAALAKLLPVSTAFTITLGIAPLLFLQVLYGPLFYTSSVLMAWSWLGVVGLLLVAYYGYYGFAYQVDKGSGSAVGWAVASALATLLIGFLFTSNMTLMLRPEAFSALYEQSEHGLHLNPDDPTLWPRFAHFVIASFAFCGLVVAILGRGRQDDAGPFMQGLGARLFTLATLVQLPSGVLFLLSLPEPARRLFLGGSAGHSALLWGSVALAVAGVLLVRRRPFLAASALGLTLTGMAVVRHLVRVAVLEPRFSMAGLSVSPQWGVFALFAVLLVAGLGVVAWMLARFFGARPAAG